MKLKKARKPRGKKLSGYPSMDMCPHCIAFGCDPMAMSDKFQAKMDRRSRAGVCRACGHNPCRCKSKK